MSFSGVINVRCYVLLHANLAGVPPATEAKTLQNMGTKRKLRPEVGPMVQNENVPGGLSPLIPPTGGIGPLFFNPR